MTKVMDELLEMGKDLKAKHSAFSLPLPLQDMLELFSWKSFASGNKLFWVNFLGDVLHWD